MSAVHSSADYGPNKPLVRPVYMSAQADKQYLIRPCTVINEKIKVRVRGQETRGHLCTTDKLTEKKFSVIHM